MFSLSKKLVSCLLVFSMLLTLATGVAASAATGKVNGNGVNFREKPSLDSKVIKVLNKGKKVKLLDKTKGWYKVKVNGKKGYIKAELVSRISSAKPAYINAGVVNFRKGPSLKAKVLKKLKYGDKLSVIGSKGRWYKVRIGKGRKKKVGYVVKKFVELGSKTSRGSVQRMTKGQQLVAYAKKFVGVKYVYGSADPSVGFDCSGLIYYVYTHFGYSIDRSSSGIADDGRTVSTSDLQPGDLLLYKQHGSYDHVAMYIGGGQMIHAETRSGVNIDPVWDNGYYENCFAKAIRII